MLETTAGGTKETEKKRFLENCETKRKNEKRTNKEQKAEKQKQDLQANFYRRLGGLGGLFSTRSARPSARPGHAPSYICRRATVVAAFLVARPDPIYYWGSRPMCLACAKRCRTECCAEVTQSAMLSHMLYMPELGCDACAKSTKCGSQYSARGLFFSCHGELGTRCWPGQAKPSQAHQLSQA